MDDPLPFPRRRAAAFIVCMAVGYGVPLGPDTPAWLMVAIACGVIAAAGLVVSVLFTLLEAIERDVESKER